MGLPQDKTQLQKQRKQAVSGAFFFSLIPIWYLFGQYQTYFVILQKVFKVFLFLTNLFLFKISHFIKFVIILRLLFRNSEYLSVLISFLIIYHFMCERNQLPLSWAVTPTVYTLKSIYRNRYYGKGAYFVPKGSQRVHSQSLDWEVSFTEKTWEHIVCILPVKENR